MRGTAKSPALTHEPGKVRRILDDLWCAPCSCGESWTAETSVKANRVRNKHIHQMAVQRRSAKAWAS